jgi:hypothetical protein
VAASARSVRERCGEVAQRPEERGAGQPPDPGERGADRRAGLVGLLAERRRELMRLVRKLDHRQQRGVNQPRDGHVPQVVQSPVNVRRKVLEPRGQLPPEDR